MGVKNYLGNGQQSTRFQRIENLLKCRLEVRNLPQHGHQQGAVKALTPEFPPADAGLKEINVFQTDG